MALARWGTKQNQYHTSFDQQIADVKHGAQLCQRKGRIVDRHQQLAHGRREARHADGLLAHPLGQAARLHNVVLRRNVHGRAEKQRRENVALKRIVRNARTHSKTIIDACTNNSCSKRLACSPACLPAYQCRIARPSKDRNASMAHVDRAHLWANQ